MARKKNLGNPLLIAAGTELATKVAANEIEAHRQRASEERTMEREQKRQDELAANQIYAKQKGVDLVAASYLRRRRNRIVAYSVLGVGAVGVVAYFAYKAVQKGKASDEAVALKSTIPPSLLENKTLNSVIRSITYGFYPATLAELKDERIKRVMSIAPKVADFDKLKKDYKLLTGNELESDMIEKCSSDTWSNFSYIAQKASNDAKAGVVQPEAAINAGGDIKKDELSYNEDNKGFWVIAKANIWLYDRGITGLMMGKHRQVQPLEFVGWTNGEAIKWDEKWGWGEELVTYFHIKGKMAGLNVDYWIREPDVLMFKTRAEVVTYINKYKGSGYGETVVNSWSLSGIAKPNTPKYIQAIANTSVSGKLVKKGTKLGVLIPEQSTTTHYAFLSKSNNTHLIPKSSAAVII